MRQANGKTDIDVIVREGKNLKGRVLGFVLRTISRRLLEKAFEKSGNAIEARSGVGNLTNHQVELRVTNNAERSI